MLRRSVLSRFSPSDLSDLPTSAHPLLPLAGARGRGMRVVTAQLQLSKRTGPQSHATTVGLVSVLTTDLSDPSDPSDPLHTKPQHQAKKPRREPQTVPSPAAFPPADSAHTTERINRKLPRYLPCILLQAWRALTLYPKGQWHPFKQNPCQFCRTFY